MLQSHPSDSVRTLTKSIQLTMLDQYFLYHDSEKGKLTILSLTKWVSSFSLIPMCRLWVLVLSPPRNIKRELLVSFTKKPTHMSHPITQRSSNLLPVSLDCLMIWNAATLHIKFLTFIYDNFYWSFCKYVHVHDIRSINAFFLTIRKLFDISSLARIFVHRSF